MICNKNSYCTNLRQHDINSQHNETHVDKKANSKIKVRVLNKVRRVLVRHDASPRVKSVGNRVMHQITYVRCVNVSKSKKSSRKIAWVLVGAENASKLGVENRFCSLAGK
jgi:ribosomal protein S7